MKNNPFNFLDWQRFNQQGFIPGPQETQDEFEQRVDFCQKLLENIDLNSENQWPFQPSDLASPSISEESFSLSNTLFGITPLWVPIFFNNYQLSMWHGGCAWIFRLHKEAPISAVLQLRHAFKNQTSYLKIYDRNELIAHEFAHVGRMAYEEPAFEEILAYQSSPSAFRRFFGPLIQSSKESKLFIYLMSTICLIDLFLFVIQDELIFISFYLLLLPFLLIVFAILRLILKQFRFKKCLKNLYIIYPKPFVARHLIYRLTDQEILLFSQMDAKEITAYILSNQASSFRWKFLNYNYPIL